MVDHTGRYFNTVEDMCNYWNIKKNTFRMRVARGYSIEKALTAKVVTKNKKIEFNGVKYNSIRELCKQNELNYSTVKNRLESGMSLEKALYDGKLENAGSSKKCKDHTGRIFNSQKEMCEHWGISVHRYGAGVKAGYSKKDILTGVYGYNEGRCKDHLGNGFKSERAMCEHYGIEREVYRGRMKRGWEQGKALTDRSWSNAHSGGWDDHRGNHFESFEAMCRHWGVRAATVKGRLDSGKSLEYALEATNAFEVTILGVTYSSIIDMCKYFEINPITYRGRIASGWEKEEALGLKGRGLKGRVGTDFKGKIVIERYLYKGRDGLDYYLCKELNNDRPIILNEENWYEYAMKTNEN